MKIVILGGGIIGRTAALAVQQAGHDVTLITDLKPEETLSAMAGATWRPLNEANNERAALWAQQTYDWLQTIPTQEENNTGLQFVDSWLHETKQNKDFRWAKVLPDFRPVVTPLRLPMEITASYKAIIPTLDMPRFLTWLMEEGSWAGVKEVYRSINNLNELQAYGEIAVVATGLKTRAIVKDSGLYPIQGQTISVVNPGSVGYHSFINEDIDLSVTPRVDDIIIGGTYKVGEETLKVDRELQRKILKKAVAFVPELAGQEINSAQVGLRPGRDEILVERRGRVIHAYGHGESGVTTSWGTAQEILSLIEGQIMM